MPTLSKKRIEILQKKKAECNAKAQEIVLHLIDGISDEYEFTNKLRWINRCHYEDITEERAIVKLCGYPLCSRKLGVIPKKKYHISTIDNKVYDMTERKLFCCNQCYKASIFVKAQLLTSPLWESDREECDAIQLLTNKIEQMEAEINIEVEGVKLPIECEIKDKITSDDGKVTSVNDSRQTDESCLNKKRNEQDVAVDEILARTTESTHAEEYLNIFLNRSKIVNVSHCQGLPNPFFDEMNFEKKSKNGKTVDQELSNSIHDRTNIEEKAPNDRRTVSKQTFKPKEIIVESSHKFSPGNCEKQKVDIVAHVEQSFREWVTVDTVCYIMGDQKVVQWMREKGQDVSFTGRLKVDPFLFERYKSICKKLKILDSEEENLENEAAVPSRSIPDYNALKEQTKEMEIKVRSFYRGDLKVSFAEDEKNMEQETSTKLNVLSPFHQHARNSIRRNNVLHKLNVLLPDLYEVFELNPMEISGKIKKLIFTFEFSAHNVMFKPVEWQLIGLILLNLLSVEDSLIRVALFVKSSLLNTILTSYQLESNYMNCLCSELTDLDRVLNKEKTEIKLIQH